MLYDYSPKVSRCFSLYTYLQMMYEGNFMDIALFWIEKSILVAGIIFVLTSITQYGRRSHDWKGIITMFYKRVPMSISEYKWYRIGVALLVCSVLLRIIALTLWP